VIVHRLVGDAYEQSARSEVLPDLDIDGLSRFVRPGEAQTQLAKGYQATLREK
jgi:hypothetical protein